VIPQSHTGGRIYVLRMWELLFSVCKVIFIDHVFSVFSILLYICRTCQEGECVVMKK
jgi:hypothetical protein